MESNALGIWALDIPASHRTVLLAMRDIAAETGSDTVKAGAVKLAWMTDYCERQMRSLLKDMVQSGLLLIVSNEPGRPTGYRINLAGAKLKPTPAKIAGHEEIAGPAIISPPAKIAGVYTEDSEGVPEPIRADEHEVNDTAIEIAGPAKIAGVSSVIESLDPKSDKDSEDQEKTLSAEIAPKKPRKKSQPSEPLPQSALTRAMHEATPEDIRPVRCNYGKHDTAAQALYKAAWKPEQIADFVAWSYQHDPYLNGQKDGDRKVIWMSFISDHIKAKWPAVTRWIAAGRPSSHQTVARSEEKDEQSILESAGRVPRSYAI